MSGDIVVCPSWGEDTGVWLGDAISVPNALQCKGQPPQQLSTQNVSGAKAENPYLKEKLWIVYIS